MAFWNLTLFALILHKLKHDEHSADCGARDWQHICVGMPTPLSASPLQSVEDAPANGAVSVPEQAIKNAPGQKVISENSAAHENTAANPPPRLKVVLRRLAPKLTQEEFEKSMGDEWKIGEGKIDWMSYMPGKLARE